MRLTHPSIALALAVFARVATAAPVLGPPVAVDRPALSPLGNKERAPVVAADGTNYLVLWKDDREGRVWNSRLMGARVDPTGKTLDPYGFVIGGPSAGVAAAFGVDEYLVAWAGDDRNITSGVYAARVRRDGAVLDEKPIELSKTSGVGPRPSVAWNGSAFLVIWTEPPGPTGGGGVRGARISKEGAILGSPGFVVSPNAPVGADPLLASDGQEVRIFFRKEPSGAPPGAFRIHAARLAADGTLSDPTGRVLVPSTGSESQDQPSVCFDGESYHLAWRQIEPGPDFAVSIRGAVVTRDGAPVAAPVVLWPASSMATNASIACSAAGSALPSKAGLARLDRAGRPLEIAPLAVATDPLRETLLASAGAATGFLVVWNQLTTLMATPVSASGLTAQPTGRRLVDVTNAQVSPAVARGASNYLAVWRDDRDGDPRIYGAILDDKGMPVSGDAISIGTDGSGLAAPAVAWNGRHYLAAWADNDPGVKAIHIVRLDGQGRILGSEARVSGIALDSVVGLASDGEGFLLAWAQPSFPPSDADGGPSSPHVDVISAHIDAEGTAARPLAVGAGPFVQNGRPAVAFGGESYLVTWIRGSDSAAAANARFVNRAGDQLANRPLTVLGKAQEGGATPVASWDGKQFLVAWSDGGHVVGRRLGPDGTFLDAGAVPLAPAVVDLRSIATAWNGQHFLVGWRAITNYSAATYATRVSAAGDLLDGDGFLIAERVNAIGGTALGLASDGNGRWLAVYDRQQPAPELQTVRVSARLLTDCLGPSCPPATLTPPDGGASSPTDGPLDSAPSEPSLDGGATIDGGRSDAMAMVSADTGITPERDADQGRHAASGGCSCRQVPSAQGAPLPWTLVLMLAVGLIRRREPRRRPRDAAAGSERSRSAARR
jgi:hypothetical protein